MGSSSRSPCTPDSRGGRASQKGDRTQFADAPCILLVEDDPDVRQFMRFALRSSGYDVAEARSAWEALELLAKTHFDLVLTDYALPGMDGIQMISEADRAGLLKSDHVMLLTAHPAPQESEELTVLTKPIDLDELLEQIAAKLGQRRS